MKPLEQGYHGLNMGKAGREQTDALFSQMDESFRYSMFAVWRHVPEARRHHLLYATIYQ
jgi:hypothetical protein